MQESVEIPDPVRLVGESVQDVLFVVRFTTPAKLLTGATVTVEVPAAPASTVSAAEFAARVKSVTLIVTVTECERLPLAPVTETV